MTAGDDADCAVHRAVERVARESYGTLCAILSARSGDLALVEDALADALAAALTRWPLDGIPRSPQAWLMTTARHRLIDRGRHDAMHAAFVDSEAAGADGCHAVAVSNSDDAWIDPRLKLLFVCTHPALDVAIRTPLMLQAVLGFDAERIAAAFLVSPSSMSQRLVRAKRKIRDARIPFEVPPIERLPERIDAVAQAVYAAYSEGWKDPLGADAKRRDFSEEAIWLGRLLVELCPDEPEVGGLLALMLYLESRRRARRTRAGEYVPLDSQSPAHWDATLVEEAESLLRSAAVHGQAGRFQLEAAIQSVHAARAHTGATDWKTIAELYEILYRLVPSPVVAVNRAVAVAWADGAVEIGRAHV